MHSVVVAIVFLVIGGLLSYAFRGAEIKALHSAKAAAEAELAKLKAKL